MPTAKVESSTGKTSFNYTISTPSASSATSIDTSLPTLLFIHAVYYGQQIFQRQFEDPQIRRFNCVALDLRLHGRTTTDGIPEGYGAKDAAEDLALFMDEARLPACHIVGLSMGTMVGIALAVHYPNRVLSLFLVSPLGLEELPDAASGRREVADIWMEGTKTGRLDMAAISDSIYGAHQLGFNNNLNSLARALDGIALPLALQISAPAKFELYERGTLDFLNNRQGYSRDELSRIRGPVKLVHCLGDIAYPLEYSERFLRELGEAGVRVSLATIPGAPHFGVVTHGDIVNWLLRGFVMDCCESWVPPALGEVKSPWEEDLVKAGWKKGGDGPEDE
ncbi:alpha/beta-hydrolase [Armillaria novae-zelandiae]|uniref:Alpha/beta-hydrolase n=1 Tax=Armillaria novae-zelandiae TaxID=153914 RepID=A0AA39U9J5_9AGAR|nr:alpha/beta-hydrolase [Armillaria novae-zelandiae]